MENAKRSVLIVDDQRVNIMEISNALRPDCTIFAAGNGTDAIAVAGEKQPDVILLDISMEGMDGFDIITALKKSEKTKDIPVIFITGRTDVESEEKALALGAVDYIKKPFSPSVIKLRVMNQIKMLERNCPDGSALSQTAKTPASVNREIEFKKELIVDFVQKNKNKDVEITEAIKAGDLVLANRLAHTLKSTAGRLGKTLLADASANIEHSLADGKNTVTPKQLEIFKAELKAALLDLTPQYEEIVNNANEMPLEPIDEKSIRELLEKITPLLKRHSTSCFDYINDLRRVPGSGELIEQINELNFSQAIDILCGMKKELNID